MNLKHSYSYQYNKLVDAYINCKINPFDNCACFVGNLLNNNSDWDSCRTLHPNSTCFSDKNITLIPRNSKSYIVLEGIRCIKKESEGFYTLEDIIRLEQEFLRMYNRNSELSEVLNEDALFLAFEEGLKVLKEIHIEKGEIIEDEFVFTKREIKELVNE